MAGRSRHPWGWHRLADAVAAELVRAGGVLSSDTVLDLGAGDGAITRPLPATGARVIAVELHPDRVRLFRRRFGGALVVRADVTDLRLPRRPFRVVADPPSDGVSAVLRRLTHRGSRMERADLIVPRSVAANWVRRLEADPRWRATVPRLVPRSAFGPRPRIDCCVLRVEATGRRR